MADRISGVVALRATPEMTRVESSYDIRHKGCLPPGDTLDRRARRERLGCSLLWSNCSCSGTYGRARCSAVPAVSVAANPPRRALRYRLTVRGRRYQLTVS